MTWKRLHMNYTN